MKRYNDPMTGIAKEALKKHFTNKKGEPITTPYYQNQLEIFYENDFFPWIVDDALEELVKEGFLELFNEKEIEEIKKLRNITKINFYVNKEATKTEEQKKLLKPKIATKLKLINKLSDPENSRTIGKHLEILVQNELRAQQFKIVGANTNKYLKKKWTKTDHNLDIIARHREEDFVIGVEVKNTLSIMEPKEIDIKIDICKHLGIIPIFAVRWIIPYLDCIRRQGGFAWNFKTQIYPLGTENFTHEIFKKFSALDKKDGKNHKLEFPITTRGDLPIGTRKTFEKWFENQKNNQKKLDTDFRCQRSSKKS